MNVGNNVKRLRVAFGETQEKLGEVLHLGKSAISKIEKGGEIPEDRLNLIARHFSVTRARLTESDLSGIQRIDVKSMKEANRATLQVLLFPTSGCASKNIYFKRGYRRMIHCMNDLLQQNPNANWDDMELSFDELYKALDDEETMYFAAVCMLTWLEFAHIIFTGNLIILEDKPAIYDILVKEGEAEDIDEDERKKLIEDCMEFLTDPALTEAISGIKTALVEMDGGIDVTLYYSALEYCFCLKDPKSDRNTNRLIGDAMMKMLAENGNKYARRFLRIMG